MKQTAVEWLFNEIDMQYPEINVRRKEWMVDKAKEMEKTNTDNKVIHFAEWLTKKHTTILMTLYQQFEEQYYNETYEKK